MKVNGSVYDGTETPIMIILDEYDKSNIKNMALNATRYAVFPDCWGTEDERSIWMKDGKQENE